MSTGQSEFGWHRVAAFMRCPQEYTYAYLYGLKPKEANVAPTLGSAVHALMATMYSKDKRFLDELQTYDPEIVRRARGIMKDYIAVSRIDVPEVLYVEHEVKMMINGCQFTRRLDLVFRDNDGNVHVVDHKTCSDIRRREQSSHFDLSLATQVLVARYVWGSEFKELWLNLICTKSVKFLCVPLRFSTAFLEDVGTTLCYFLPKVSSFQAKMFEAPRTWHCKVGPHTCDYFSLCAYGQSALSEYRTEKREQNFSVDTQFGTML